MFGFFTAAHAIAVTQSQHSYYRNARGRMKASAEDIELPDGYVLSTTPGMQGKDTCNRLARFGRVTWMH